MKPSNVKTMASQIEIIAIAPNTWTQHWELYQRLPVALAKYVPVTYVQEPEQWHKSRAPRDEGLFVTRQSEPSPNVQLLKLPKLLARRGRDSYWNRVTYRIKSRLINRRSRNGVKRILYLWHPALLPYCEYLKPDVVIYHIFDIRPPTTADCGSIDDYFLRACEQATIVLAGTEQQAEFVRRSDVAIVGNAVPIEEYTVDVATPCDLASLRAPRIGFIGSITDRLDFDWFNAISDNEAWNLVLAGPCRSLSPENIDRFDSLRQRPNVAYLGCKEPSDVAAYLRGLDVGLMNYRCGTHCDVASPIKLYEYSAAGLPIVSTPLKSLVAMDKRENLYFADTPEDAVKSVQACLDRGRSQQDIEARIRFASENSWDARAEQILSLVRAKLAHEHTANT